MNNHVIVIETTTSHLNNSVMPTECDYSYFHKNGTLLLCWKYTEKTPNAERVIKDVMNALESISEGKYSETVFYPNGEIASYDETEFFG